MQMVGLAFTHSVYPRWRGEHQNALLHKIDVIGLSPLARGTHSGASRKFSTSRFIPAGAGNTPTEFTINLMATVYPRWRGEHFLLTAEALSAAGLSPLARGTPKPFTENTILKRFIPAGAGNTE